MLQASQSAHLTAPVPTLEVMLDAVAQKAAEEAEIAKDTNDNDESERNAKYEDEIPRICRCRTCQLRNRSDRMEWSSELIKFSPSALDLMVIAIAKCAFRIRFYVRDRNNPHENCLVES